MDPFQPPRPPQVNTTLLRPSHPGPACRCFRDEDLRADRQLEVRSGAARLGSFVKLEADGSLKCLSQEECSLSAHGQRTQACSWQC